VRRITNKLLKIPSKLKNTQKETLSLSHSKSAPWPLYSTWRHCATRIQNLTNGTTHSQICTRKSSGTNSLSNSNSLSPSQSFRSDSQLFILLLSLVSLSLYVYLHVFTVYVLDCMILDVRVSLWISWVSFFGNSVLGLENLGV